MKYGRLISLVVFGTVVLGCSASPSVSRSGDAAGGAPQPPRPPKDIVVIGSGNPPGMDNRFVVTSNNANAILLGLYAGQLVVSDNTGARMPRLAEAVPSLENGLWKLLPDNTMET